MVYRHTRSVSSWSILLCVIFFMLHVYRKRVTGEELFICTPVAYSPGVFYSVLSPLCYIFIGIVSLEKKGLSVHQKLIFLESFTLCYLCYVTCL